VERSRAVRTLSGLGAGLMIAVLCVAAAPAWDAGAAQHPAAQPVRVRVVPAVNALGGRLLAPGDVLYRPVAVHNDGDAAFVYRLAIVTIRRHGPLADHLLVELRAAAPCDTATFAGGPTLAGPAAVAALGASAPRPVAPGAVERLCLRVELPADVPTGVHGAELDAVLQVTARDT
jgi:hypothetical protein